MVRGGSGDVLERTNVSVVSGEKMKRKTHHKTTCTDTVFSEIRKVRLEHGPARHGSRGVGG